MRISITTFPPDGVEILNRTYMTPIIRLYKDLQTEVVNDDTRLTADVVEITLPYYDGLRDDIVSNFDYYFERGRKLELEEAKQKKREEVKGRLLTVEYNVLMAQYKAIDEATTLEEVEEI